MQHFFGRVTEINGMLQKSRFRIQLYPFDPTNAASEPKKTAKTTNSVFGHLTLQFREACHYATQTLT
jgi:hypothetical protein